jgi:hypothetical protein
VVGPERREEILRLATDAGLTSVEDLANRPFHSWARLDGPWSIVTDDDAPAEVVDEFRRAGRDIVVVSRGGGR